MLYKIYNECLLLSAYSAQFSQLPETATLAEVIKAMTHLMDKIKKQPSLAHTKKEDWETHIEYLSMYELLTIEDMLNYFEQIKNTVEQEFPVAKATPPKINKKGVFKSTQDTGPMLASLEKEKAMPKKNTHEASYDLKELYRLYQEIEKKYAALSGGASSSGSGNPIHHDNDEQIGKYMMRVAQKTQSKVLKDFFDESTFKKFNDIRNDLQREDINDKIPLLNELGIILADLFQLQHAQVEMTSTATKSPMLIVDFGDRNNDPLAYYKSIYNDYMKMSELLTTIPASNNHHQGPLVEKNFDSAEAILLALLDYTKKLNLSFLDGFIEGSLYNRLQLELDKVKLLDEKATREQLFVAISGFNTSFMPVLKNIGFQISNTIMPNTNHVFL